MKGRHERSGGGRVARFVRRLLRSESGAAIPYVYSTTLLIPLSVGLSFMKMQLAQSSHHRDMVDHAASVATDEATKNLCTAIKDATPIGAFAGQRKQAVMSKVQPVLPDACECQVNVRPTVAPVTDPGARPSAVSVTCSCPCSFPFAAQVMCKDGRMTFTADQTAVPMGCDAAWW